MIIIIDGEQINTDDAVEVVLKAIHDPMEFHVKFDMKNGDVKTFVISSPTKENAEIINSLTAWLNQQQTQNRLKLDIMTEYFHSTFSTIAKKYNMKFAEFRRSLLLGELSLTNDEQNIFDKCFEVYQLTKDLEKRASV